MNIFGLGGTTPQLSRNMFAGVFSASITTVLMLISYRVYLRLLGYEQYGLWVVLSTVVTFAQLSNLGLGLALCKQIAADHSTGNDRAVTSCVSTALCTLLVTGLLACCAITVLRYPIVALFHLSRSNELVVLPLLPAVAVLSFYAIYIDTFTSVLSGLGRMDLYSYLQLVGQLFAVGTTIIFLNLHWGVSSFVIGNATSFLAVHLIASLTLRRVAKYRIFEIRAFSWAVLARMLKISIYLSASSLLSILVSPVNKLLLSRYVGVSTLPLYDIIVTGSMKVRSLLEAAIRALMPEVSRLAANRSYAAIACLNKSLTTRLLIVGGALLTGAILLCGFAVQAWLGPLAQNFPLIGLRVVLVAAFVSTLGVPAYYTLLGLGKSSHILAANALQSGISFVIVLAIVKMNIRLTLLDALIAVALGLVSSNLYLMWENIRTITLVSRLATAPNEVTCKYMTIAQ